QPAPVHSSGPWRRVSERGHRHGLVSVRATAPAPRLRTPARKLVFIPRASCLERFLGFLRVIGASIDWRIAELTFVRTPFKKQPDPSGLTACRCYAPVPLSVDRSGRILNS